MPANIPFVHLIELYNDKYVYDVNTNAILQVSDEVYSFLQKITSSTSMSAEQVRTEYDALDEFVRQDVAYMAGQGFLRDRNADVQFKHPETDRLEEYYRSNLGMMTLQVTQNCNLRCKYCVYSGSYINRTHTNKRMNRDTALDAIRFLYDHSAGSQSVTIGFYGGEPLLEYDLIKECVAYAQKLFRGKSLAFNMTSNATLLTEDKVLFLAEHGFHLTVSLDGPANIQNKNRIFASSSQGTFETVLDRLEMVKRVCSEFLENITFNAVIDLKQDASCASQFFLTYDLVREIGVHGNYVDSNNKKDSHEEDDVPPEFYANSNYEVFKVYLSHCTNLLKEYGRSLYGFHVAVLHNQMVERSVYNKRDSQFDCPGGQCLPGIQRLLVNVDGRLFPCERVNESSDAMCIGDIYRGFDIENARRLLNVSSITEQECRKCWCYKMCEMCCGKAERDGHLDRERRLSFCNSSRLSVEESIKNYVTLKKCGCRDL